MSIYCNTLKAFWSCDPAPYQKYCEVGEIMKGRELLSTLLAHIFTSCLLHTQNKLQSKYRELFQQNTPNKVNTLLLENSWIIVFHISPLFFSFRWENSIEAPPWTVNFESPSYIQASSYTSSPTSVFFSFYINLQENAPLEAITKGAFHSI